jgi:membrane-bound lytic murein transglycosylase D
MAVRLALAALPLTALGIAIGIWLIPMPGQAQDSSPRDAPSSGESLRLVEEFEGAASPQDSLNEIAPEASEEPQAATPEENDTAGETPLAAVPPIVETELFPAGPVIQDQKTFWIRIFTNVQSNEGLLHDEDLTQPVYEKLVFGTMRLRAQHVVIRQRIAGLQARLRQLAADVEAGRALNAEQQELLGQFPPGATVQRLRAASKSVRFQRGLADRFRDGMVLSGLYLRHMEEILSARGVPTDLVFLPHVESSFNYRTYSRAGAAGIWQFTRGTGKQYMRIGYEVDERLDPLLATRAAAELLSDNHQRLGSWPLAITAYNHGRQSLERIVGKTGTRDLSHLIEHYNGWLFKFASKNFYAEFLAAREVASHPERYFGGMEVKPTLRYQHVELPFYVDFKHTARLLGMGPELLQELNPSLRPPVLQGMKYIPKGYSLRLPDRIEPAVFLEAIPNEQRYAAQKRTTEVIVMRGDTLSDLGKRYSVPWQQIAIANNLSAFRSIRPGQRLILPDGKGAVAAAVAAQSTAPSPPRAGASKPARTPLAQTAPVAQTAPMVATAVAAAVAAQRSPAEGVAMPGATDQAVPESIALQRAEGASLFQDLDLRNPQAASQRAELVAAYGETVGHYAEWSGTTPELLGRLNGRGRMNAIRPGERLLISLSRVSADEFLQKRHEFHQSREEDFFSVYAVTELQKLVIKRGDTAWSIAQSNNVPMWLFYQHNPGLINGPLNAGMTVLLPIIEAIQDIQRSEPAARSGQAG